jgi:sRNA-binding carbon storage regulator CsrA
VRVDRVHGNAVQISFLASAKFNIYRSELRQENPEHGSQPLFGAPTQ